MSDLWAVVVGEAFHLAWVEVGADESHLVEADRVLVVEVDRVLAVEADRALVGVAFHLAWAVVGADEFHLVGVDRVASADSRPHIVAVRPWVRLAAGET